MTQNPGARGRRTAAVVTLALALTATLHPPAGAEPQTLPEVRAELDRLYHRAEVATERYNALDGKITRQEKRLGTLRAQVAAAERKLSRLTALAGAAARSQYRGGGVPAEVQFALARDPERALDNASLARQAQLATRRTVGALTTAQEELRTRSDAEGEELRRLRKNRGSLGSHRRTIQSRIREARKVESGLAEKQRRELAALEHRAADEAQAEWVRSGVLDGAGTEGSSAGREAVVFATRELGKPYVWGAEGPDSYDCSGLTSQAWLAAGVVIPRTSQEQWRLLHRVPVAKMRPGDLIIHNADASHVSLYIGDGRMIHAPRPGRNVTVAPAGSMEILGVVRPDA
ncbi:glycoside hydrolase [Streptomyces qaidamensis]|uniref:Glycoside hydrolase n=1 Tax=Streptomyces qaidamensis TaxID=1783515 RepID=A0A143C8I9_9ACTN|nr:C40 family peptidase [Streptomyces qaidamensis]AMW13754.1 glycoside hydrolase [Streptomyces qaidamensis]